MRKRVVLCKWLILFFQILCLVGLQSNVRISAQEASKILIISKDTGIYINVSEQKDDREIFLEAEKSVKKYLEQYDVEYINPDEIIFGDIAPEYIYGCEKNQKIYIDNKQSKDEIYSTIVHELLHLQNPNGFDSKTEFDTIIGHNLTEAVVEKMTIEITNQPETERTKLLSKWTTDTTFQMLCEDFFYKSNLIEELLNEDMYKVVYHENEYMITTFEYFKVSFDRWMIGDELKSHFWKMRGRREP